MEAFFFYYSLRDLLDRGGNMHDGIIPVAPRRRSRVGRTVHWSLIVILGWHFAAAVVNAAHPTFNGDNAPDSVVRMPAHEFAAEKLGLKSGTPVPLQLKLPEVFVGGVELRLVTIYDD